MLILNPFPAFLLFAAVEFDVLHSADHLHDIALVVGGLLEPHVVELAPPAEEEQDPSDVEDGPDQEYQQDGKIVSAQHYPVDYQQHYGHYYAQQGIGEEVLDSVVVLDALHDISRHLRVEEGDGQAHQFGEKVGNQGDAHARGHVQHQPVADEVVRQLARDYEQLGDEHRYYEAQAAERYALVHHRLGDEGQQQAQEAGHDHREEDLDYALAVRPQISCEMPQGEAVLFLVVVMSEPESRFDFHFGHFIGIGKRELQNQIRQTAFQGDITIGYRTIALDVGNNILHVDIAITDFPDVSLHLPHRQLTAFLFTHDTSTAL